MRLNEKHEKHSSSTKCVQQQNTVATGAVAARRIHPLCPHAWGIAPLRCRVPPARDAQPTSYTTRLWSQRNPEFWSYGLTAQDVVEVQVQILSHFGTIEMCSSIFFVLELHTPPRTWTTPPIERSLDQREKEGAATLFCLLCSQVLASACLGCREAQ